MLDLYQSTYRAMVPGLNPFEFLHNSPSAAAAPAQPAAATTEDQAGSPQSDSGAEDLNQLKTRIAELEKTVSSLTPAKPTAPARREAPKKPNRRTKVRKQ